jgi:hypothetical protein
MINEFRTPAVNMFFMGCSALSAWSPNMFMVCGKIKVDVSFSHVPWYTIYNVLPSPIVHIHKMDIAYP